jgi:RNA polymerase sigma-70 factor, ECF subfamily
MHDVASRMTVGLSAADSELEREFETRLVESSKLAFRVAYSVLRHRQDAEDVAQDAFTKAYRNFHQLRDRERFRAWLVRITWRLALDRRRGDKRRAAHEETTPGDDALEVADSGARLAPDAMVARERAERLWKAVDELPDKLRVAIVLANIEGHDIAEIASLLGVPVGTVKSRLFLARQRLKELLQ